MRRVAQALLLLCWLGLVSCGQDPGEPGQPHASQSVTLDPDHDVTVDVGDGRAVLEVPKGSVSEHVEVSVVSLEAADVPAPDTDLGVTRVVNGLRVDGLLETMKPIRIAFALPADLEDPQVLHHHAGGWSMMPSYLDEDGRLAVRTSTFSTFALVSATTQNATYRYQADGFDPVLYGVHARNDGRVFNRVGVVKDPDEFLGFCYGMAETAALYYLADTRSPTARDAYLAGGDDVFNTIHSQTYAEFIRLRQHQQWVTGTTWELVRLADPRSWDAITRAEDIYIRMMLGAPVIMIVSDLKVDNGYHHAVLVYQVYKRINRDDDTLQYEFWIYDPNGYSYFDGHHEHYASRVIVDVSSYEAGRWQPWLRSTEVTYDLPGMDNPRAPDLQLFFGVNIFPIHAGLPWTNPEVATFGAHVTGDTVHLSAEFSHPSPGGAFAEAVWYIEGERHGYLDLSSEDSSGTVPITGSSATYSFHDLPTDRYLARVMVQDVQGNWSRALSTNFAVAHADVPSIASFVATPASVAEGEASVLSWLVAGSEPLSLTIDRGIGDVTGRSSVEVYPTTETTYRLTASNAHGADSREVTVVVDAVAGPVPTAHLVTDPAGQVRVDSMVELDATGSTFGDGERSTYEFRSGDGRTVQESWGRWVLSYPTEGAYEPCVRVRNTLGTWSSWTCQTLNVVREAAGGPDLTIVQYTIPGWIGPKDPSYWEIRHGDTFDLTVAWFNDGDPLPSDHPRFFLQVRANGEVLAGRGYSGGIEGDERTLLNLGGNLEPGEYTIMMIIDANNVIEEVDETNNTASFSLRVDSVPPSADFSVSTDCLTAAFTDTSTHPMGDARIVRRTWDFGDGNSNTQRNPTHTFSSEGTYNVRRSVEDEWGNTDTRTRAVSVEACMNPIVVSVSPETVTLPANTDHTFAATVTGTTNTSVTWTTTCGTITGTGNTVTYTAPASAGTCGVRATSVEDTDAWAEATLTVETAGNPEWRASPTQLDFFADVGDPAPPPQSFTLYNDGPVAGSFSLNAGGMTQVSPGTGSISAGGSQQISVSVAACPDPGTTTSLITLPDTPVTVGVRRTCGEPEPDVGMIQVIISGLPSGVNADVFISGQGWMLWPTSSVLFSDMPPGWYQMTAEAIASEGATYEPTPSGESFLVEADQTTTVTITYELAEAPAPSRTYRSVAAGASSSYAIDTDDRVWAWGANRYGQLGNGTTTNRLTPTAVTGLGRVQAVSGGSRHALAIVGGRVYAWGENWDGELGTTSVCVGRDCYSAVPVEAGSFTQAIDVAAGAGYSMALRADGNVFMWGRNYGTGPAITAGISSVTAIAAGQNHMLALRSNGTVWSWGSNGAGELGSGDYVDRNTPGQVLDLTNVVAIAAGESFSMALRSDGSVWAWGYNNLGQLGDGTTTWRTRPVRVSGISTATAIHAGNHHGLAVLSDGSVRAWGLNTVGQLGDGTTTNRLTPVSASGLHSAVGVAAGSGHSLAVLGNAHAMAWGGNWSGQLGDGTTTSRTRPVPIAD